MKRAALPLALVALVGITTGARFGNAFVFDDVHVIVDGTVIHDPSQLGAVWTRHTMFASDSDQGGTQSVDTYRPVPITLFMLDAAFSGRSPVGYHVTNLLLHVAVVLLVFALALAWRGPEARAAAFYGAAVFAAHPWAVEAHVWINGRSDPLSAAFGLGAMWLWLEAERGRGAWRWPAGAGLFLLGLLSKETLLLVAPAVLVMPASWTAPHPLMTRVRARLAWVALPCVAYLGIRAWVLHGLSTHRDASMLWDAVYHLPWLLADSLYRALIPGVPFLRSLRDEYAALTGWQVALGVFVVALAAGVAWRARRRYPVASWSIGWFLAPLLPIAIVSTVLWPGFGRYLYLPLAGLAWGLAEIAHLGLKRLPDRRRVFTVAMLLHVGVCVFGAASYTMDFRSSDALYLAAIRARPEVAMGYGWLGLSRLRRGDAGGAIAPLSHASRLDPETHRYLINESRARLVAGDRAGAAAVAARGIDRFHDRPEEASYHLLAINSMTERDSGVALGHLARCLEVWPGRPDCEQAVRFMLVHDPDAEANREHLSDHPELRRFLPGAEGAR